MKSVYSQKKKGKKVVKKPYYLHLSDLLKKV